MCRSARSAHCFETGLRRGRHRVNCQFSTHRGFYRRLANQAYGAYPRRKRRGFAPVQPDNKRTPRLSGRGLSDTHSSETTRLGPAGVVCRPKLNGNKLEVVRTNRDTPTPTASGGSCPRRTGMGDHHSCGGGLRVRSRARGWGIPAPSARGGCQSTRSPGSVQIRISRRVSLSATHPLPGGLILIVVSYSGIDRTSSCGRTGTQVQ